ncbi:hypothetical protein CHL78_009380 [Romboutsia weinsteinii]|uniref:LPXTG cell wall anchor domain-containing protein n=1 Tax=Romboutsia weinsteinii TaxID=2020949 RepID=A0A371J424_9FIRM|nr:hypothetical protein [Romboutsia weinsteinii]RDY27416.1 hypothetical protein CHL78_009380 [Romboutsia weinsteinii]
MKIFLKIFIVAVSLLSIITTQGDALEKSPPNVVLEGNAKGIIYLPGDEAFLLGENIAPGDKITRTLEIKNKYDKSYQLYLRAERVTPEEKYDLMKVINLKITYKDDVLYEGPVSGEDGMVESIDLGTYKPDTEQNLVATVEFDPSISKSNPSYWNKYAQVDWIFTAQAKEDDSTVDKPSNDTGSSGGSNSPQTGDSGMLTYAILGGASVVVLCKLRKKGK